jgi:transcriptional regulator with XRE-family HTH domain
MAIMRIYSFPRAVGFLAAARRHLGSTQRVRTRKTIGPHCIQTDLPMYSSRQSSSTDSNTSFKSINNSALECGMARSYLGGVERGKRNIALLNICKLADALSVSPAEMLKFQIG